MNLYAYARDNPMRHTDPTGHYFGRMFTDFSDSGTWFTFTTCSGDTCTVTNTDRYDGYTSSVSTQISTSTAAGTTAIRTPTGITATTVVTQTTAYTTTMADAKTNSMGGGTTLRSGYVSSSSDLWTTTEPTPGGDTSTSQFTKVVTPFRGHPLTELVIGYVATDVGVGEVTGGIGIIATSTLGAPEDAPALPFAWAFGVGEVVIGLGVMTWGITNFVAGAYDAYQCGCLGG